MSDLRPMVRAFLERQRRAEDAIRARDAERRSRLGEVAATLTRDFGATEVVLFGSLAEGDAHAASDVDLAVRGIPAARYFEALARASELLGCDVDLVELETARPSLRARIEESGEVLSHG